MAIYAMHQATFDMYLMAIFGVVGYLMKKFGFSVAAFIIAFILGSGAEAAVRQSMLLDDSGAMIFLERPVALFFIFVGFATIGLRIWQSRRKTLT